MTFYVCMIKIEGGWRNLFFGDGGIRASERIMMFSV